jgi:hypothetical protein
MSKYNWEEEWVEMPEYDNEWMKPYKSINLKFRTKEDYDKFAELLGQNLTDKTKSAWFPKAERGTTKDMRYTDSNES